MARAAGTGRQAHRDLWFCDAGAGHLAIDAGRLRVETEVKRRLLRWAVQGSHEDVLRVMSMIYDDHADWRPNWDVVDPPDTDRALA